MTGILVILVGAGELALLADLYEVLCEVGKSAAEGRMRRMQRVEVLCAKIEAYRGQ